MSRALLVLVLAAGCSFQPAATPPGTQVADARPASGGSPDGAVDAAAAEKPDAPVADGQPDAPPAPDAGTVTPATHHHFVTSSLRVGSSATEARSFGFDLDGDGAADNKLGLTLAGLGGALGVDATLDDALVTGSLVLLHSVRATGLGSSADALWRTYRGEPQPFPDLTSGNGSFSVAAGARLDSAVPGSIAGGAFAGADGLLAIELAITGGAPLALELIDARVEAGVNARGCEGRMGGGVTAKYLDAAVIPWMAELLDAAIAADGDCRESYDACSEIVMTLLAVFDTNGDRYITAAELRANPVVLALLVPDVDLLDASGAPGKDGLPDSVSMAFAITCVRAGYAAPWED
jgi:hypothetical protein